ncbi:MAG: DUF1800 family protein [Phycisphaerae bacterium]
MARLHPALEPYSHTSETPWDRTRAAHLLNRAGFGGTEAEIEAVFEAGPVASVDRLLDFPDAPADEQSRTDVPDLSHIEGYPRTFRERREKLRTLGREERQAFDQMLRRGNRQAVLAAGEWWIERMARGPYPLQEKLALFWHGHFTSSAENEQNAWLLWQQNELHRRMAAGNFKAYVKQISRDPAMLTYLNNQQNRKDAPNENYARELMELFTLGVGEYTENDIKQVARCFTGWQHDGEQFVFNANQHDTGTKRVFGFSGPFGGDEVVEILMRHPACPGYICGRLIDFFITATPDEAVARSLGQQLKEADFEFRVVLRTLLTSRYFYDEAHVGTKIKSPVQLVAGTAHILSVDPPRRQQLLRSLNKMGQVPFYPPNVKGWPGGRTWINTATLFERYNLAVEMAANTRVETEGDPARIVDRWLGRLVHRPVHPSKRQTLVTFLGQRPSDGRVREMVQLIVTMPEYQLC